MDPASHIATCGSSTVDGLVHRDADWNHRMDKPSCLMCHRNTSGRHKTDSATLETYLSSCLPFQRPMALPCSSPARLEEAQTALPTSASSCVRIPVSWRHHGGIFRSMCVSPPLVRILLQILEIRRWCASGCTDMVIRLVNRGKQSPSLFSGTRVFQGGRKEAVKATHARQIAIR